MDTENKTPDLLAYVRENAAQFQSAGYLSNGEFPNPSQWKNFVVGQMPDAVFMDDLVLPWPWYHNPKLYVLYPQFEVNLTMAFRPGGNIGDNHVGRVVGFFNYSSEYDEEDEDDQDANFFMPEGYNNIGAMFEAWNKQLHEKPAASSAEISLVTSPQDGA